MKIIPKNSGPGVYPSNPLTNNNILATNEVLQVYDDGTNFIAIERGDALHPLLDW